MNNDLIRREALKKEVENLVVGGEEGLKNYYENGSKSDENSWIGGVYDAWELINNAPTVDISGNEYFPYRTAYFNGVADGRATAKPQGEWGKWVITEIQCPNCFEYFETDCYSTEELQKCPNCGERLKGGAE